MDALEDTHHAISAYVSAALTPEHQCQGRELGERYLRTYGVMQAFVIQQDAARNLRVSLSMGLPQLATLLCKTRPRNFRDELTSFLKFRWPTAGWNSSLLMDRARRFSAMSGYQNSRRSRRS